MHLKTGYLSGLNENLLLLIRKGGVFHRASLTILPSDYVSPLRDKFKGLNDCRIRLCGSSFLVVLFLFFFFFFYLIRSFILPPGPQLELTEKLFGKELYHTTIIS